MNSLEFIEKEIKTTKKSYSAFDLDYMLFGRESDKKESERLLKKLKHLQQIKTELEAWYILKFDLEHTENELGEHEIELRKFYTDADVEIHDTKEKYYTLKKALEVQDD